MNEKEFVEENSRRVKCRLFRIEKSKKRKKKIRPNSFKCTFELIHSSQNLFFSDDFFLVTLFSRSNDYNENESKIHLASNFCLPLSTIRGSEQIIERIGRKKKKK